MIYALSHDFELMTQLKTLYFSLPVEKNRLKFIAYPCLLLVTLCNYGVVCVIHDNPNFHTRKWGSRGSCQNRIDKKNPRLIESSSMLNHLD